ncbi:MAG TPA: hypothetical protein VHG08_10175 [Longimicrobium sp.]|nr:hypothetical protein [Longimicrobium sp.]
MNTFICIVEDVFQIAPGRGCVIAPGLPVDSDLRIGSGDGILLKRPDGPELETIARGIAMGGLRKRTAIPILLAIADKAEIPIGTEVWLLQAGPASS